MTNRIWKILPALLPVVLYLGCIGIRPLFIPDEPRYAQIAREMRQSGAYAAPRLLDLPYYEKPALGHWLNAGAQAVFGENPFSARFSSALATLLTAWLVYALCRRSGLPREEGGELGLTASSVYLTTGLVFAVGTYAVLDAPFTLFVTACVTAFFYAVTEPRPGRRAGYLAAAGVAAGLAFLTKGFIAFVIPALTAVGYLIWSKQARRILTLPWLPLAAAVLTALPWAWRVHAVDPDFWNYFFWVEHIQRAVGRESGQHPQGPWFFLPVLIGGALPWLLLVAPIRNGFRRIDFSRPLIQYAAVLVVAVMVFFSIPNGKLATYILPAFPGVAILIAWGLLAYFKRCDAPWRAFDLTLKITVWTLTAATVLFLLWHGLGRLGVIPAGYLLYRPREPWLIAGLALAALLLLWCVAQSEKAPAWKIGMFAAGTGVAMLCVHGVMPGRFTAHLAPERFIREIAGLKLRPGVLLLADKDLAVVTGWALGTVKVGVYDRPGELAYGLQRPENAGRQVSPERLAELVKAGTPVIVVTDSAKRVRVMPNPKRYTRAGKNFIVEFNL